MKILIAGATGIIGESLVDKFIKFGFSLSYLTTNKNKINYFKNANGFYWKPSEGYIDLDCFNDVSYIINLSGYSVSNIWTKKNKKKIIDSRVLSTKLLFNSIKLKKDSLKIKHYISASAIGCYISSINKIYDEHSNIGNNSFLQKLVFEWENEANNFNTIDCDVTIIRIGLVLSKNGGLLKPLKFFSKFGLGSTFGSGNQFQSWIHLEDLASIFLFVVQNDLSGIYNAVSPNPVSQNELLKSISQILNRPFFLPSIPSFFVKMIMGEMSTLVLDSQNVSSGKIINNGFKFKFPFLKMALRTLL
jgi:uncharacterized protein (TIGR01777 family)